MQNLGASVTPSQVNQIIDQKIASIGTTTLLNYNDIAFRFKRLVGDYANDLFEREIIAKIKDLTT